MSMVFASLGMSLDGFIAGPNAGPDNNLGDGGDRIHGWMYRVEAWRERQSLEGGEVNRDAELLEENYGRVGAFVMGRRMFDEGEVGWPDPPPFRAPVFVLTHQPREPWERQGGTTFTFVTDGPARAGEVSCRRKGRARRRGRGDLGAVPEHGSARPARDPPRACAARRGNSALRPRRRGQGNARARARRRSPAVTHVRYRLTS